MNTQHTPGPWKTNENAAGNIWIQGGDSFIAEITPAYGAVPLCVKNAREANARLIAAAPELLEIVRQIAESKDYSELHMDEIGQQARAAIAKATQP